MEVLPDLGELENEVMQVVWSKQPVTAEAVREQLERRLRESTVRTVLRRLEGKGYVTHTVEGRTYVYRATHPRAWVAAKAVERFVNWFCNGSVDGLTVGVLGLTFKPNTDDMRDAPSLDIVPALQAAGARIVAFDPEGMKEAARLLPGIAFAKTAYDAAFEADVLVVITEWPEFRGLDPRRLKQVMRQPRIVDLRNIFNPEEMRGLGFAYEGVGRPLPRS